MGFFGEFFHKKCARCNGSLECEVAQMSEHFPVEHNNKTYHTSCLPHAIKEEEYKVERKISVHDKTKDRYYEGHGKKIYEKTDHKSLQHSKLNSLYGPYSVDTGIITEYEYFLTSTSKIMEVRTEYTKKMVIETHSLHEYDDDGTDIEVEKKEQNPGYPKIEVYENYEILYNSKNIPNSVKKAISENTNTKNIHEEINKRNDEEKRRINIEKTKKTIEENKKKEKQRKHEESIRKEKERKMREESRIKSINERKRKTIKI